MAAAQAARAGTMAAVMGLAPESVADLCSSAAGDGSVSIANLNGAGQIVVSGDVAAVERFVELALAAGADHAARLPVGAAFHSILMAPVEAAMRVLLAGIDFADPKVPLVANFNAEVVTTGAGVREALVRQVASPVRWEESLLRLASAGVRSYLELGPGRVLTGLLHLALPEAEAHAIDSPERLDRFFRLHGGFAGTDPQ